MAEQGSQGFEVSSWIGIMAPARTPAAPVQRLQDATAKALSDPDLSAFLDSQGAEPAAMGAIKFGEYLRAEIARWGKVIKAAGVRLDE